MNKSEITMLNVINQILIGHPNLAPATRELANRFLTSDADNLKHVFSEIFQNNKWRSAESVSGTGSELKYTENLRKHLPNLFEEFGVKKVLDAPCGDFNWMKEISKNLNIHYTGGDIVPELISKNISNYQSPKTKFIVLDITTDKLPDADLMICRDCLFHLSYENIEKFINNFNNSNIEYLLTTSHTNNRKFKNKDIANGGFRLIDLLDTPFNFPAASLKNIDDWIPGYPERKMILWSKSQLQAIRCEF